jgi:HK97 family phage major capsid protein
MRRVPFLLNVPRQTGTGAAGAWVAEGHSSAVVAFSFDPLRLEPRKMQSITVLSRELLKVGYPAAESAVRAAILGGAAAYLDGRFLTPVVGGSDANPASITSGGTAVTSTGSTAAAMVTDFGAMLDAVTTSGRGLTWMMQPQTAARVALVLGAAAADLPRTFLGLPVIMSSTSPAQIT